MSNGYEWRLSIKYDPGQPRVPAGDPRGGQWTSSGSGGAQFHPSDDIVQEARDWAIENIEKLARFNGTTYEKAKELVFERLEKDLKSPIVMRRSFDTSATILEEGRFKSQFETMHSAGVFNPDLRKVAENQGLGIPTDISPENRPIYAAVDAPGTNISFYGDVEWVFKEQVKERATITLGDSLYNFEGAKAVGTPYLKPDIDGFDTAAEYYGRAGIEGIGYIEVQISGGLTLADVAKIRVTRPPDYYLDIYKKLGAKYGIEIEVEE